MAPGYKKYSGYGAFSSTSWQFLQVRSSLLRYHSTVYGIDPVSQVLAINIGGRDINLNDLEDVLEGLNIILKGLEHILGGLVPILNDLEHILGVLGRIFNMPETILVKRFENLKGFSAYLKIVREKLDFVKPRLMYCTCYLTDITKAEGDRYLRRPGRRRSPSVFVAEVYG